MLLFLLHCATACSQSNAQSAASLGGQLCSCTHLGCCSFRACDIDGLSATIRALFYLILHFFTLSQTAKPLCLNAALQIQKMNKMLAGKRLYKYF